MTPTASGWPALVAGKVDLLEHAPNVARCALGLEDLFARAGAGADIPPEAPAYRQEVFGPVAPVHRARDLDPAITLAHDSPYGLGSSVRTNERDERERFVRELEAGMTFINAMVASDPRLPFGEQAVRLRPAARRSGDPRVHQRRDRGRLRSDGEVE